MGRITTDELQGYAFNVLTGEEQVYDDGMPVFNGSGEPKMRTVWRFRFAAPTPDGGMHVVITPSMDVEAKNKLVQALTHGIIPASSLDGLVL